MFSVSNKNISIILFSVLILYKIIGVSIHKQYGFGLYYWPVQLLILLMLSFIYLVKNIKELKYIFNYNLFPYHLYVFLLLLILSIYITIIPETFYLNFNKKILMFFETISWYIISLVLILNFNRIVSLIKSNIMLKLYGIVLFFFFLFDFHIQGSITEALIIGPNFPVTMMDSLPGYTWGFHLFFSQYFAVFSLATILVVQKDKKYTLSYLISILSLYVLLLAGGRGTLLSFAIVLFLFVFSKKEKSISILILFLILSSATFLANIFSENERMYKLLTFTFEDDASGSGRMELLKQNLKIIENNYIFGALRSYYEGKFIHNILSILQDYGIFPFTILVMILIHGTYIFIIKTKKMKNNLAFIMAKCIFFFSLIDHLFFKYSSGLNEILPMIITYSYALLFLKFKYFQNQFKFRRPSFENLNNK